MKWKIDFAPRIIEKMEKSRRLSQRWEVEWNRSGRHEIYWDDIQRQICESYIVRLQYQSCTCKS